MIKFDRAHEMINLQDNKQEKRPNSSQAIFDLQNKLYQYPYHHIPHLDKDGYATIFRKLDWGVHYLCLLCEAKNTIEELNVESLLDVGCGDGAFINMLKKSIDMTGVDLSEQAIYFAQGFNSNHAQIMQMDAGDLNKSFDIVTAIEVLEHIPDNAVEGFLDTLVERTKKGGYIYATVPSTNLPLNKKHYRHYNFSLLEQHMQPGKRGLTPVSVKYFYKDVWWLKYYKRLCDNRFFTGEFHPLRRLLWEQSKKASSQVDKYDGYNIVALYKKT